MSRLHTYAQLVRLPMVPSALADICLGALAAHALPGRWLPFLLLLLASACLYCGGMVWNDYFDIEQDRKERPFRPLPSGRVTPREAALLGTGLLAAGVVLALGAGWVQVLRGDTPSPMRPALLALLLVGAILLYNRWLKRFWAGPIGMGTCRFLNVLLGLSVSGTLLGSQGALLALVVGLYVAGVTWFARTEARTSSQAALRGAAGVMLASLVLALPLPVVRDGVHTSFLFPYLLVAFGFAIGLPITQAIASPRPELVQAAVKRALLGLVILDSILATALAGTIGLVLLVLLAPALYLSRKRWLYAT